jgi:UDP:flavonoid glycosyltransferase YjiC (YdhE family)
MTDNLSAACVFLQLINKGVGESIPSEQMTVRSLISGVTKILCDSSYKDRASHMSDSIRASPGMMQQALDTILGFAQGGATAGNA